MSTQVIICHPTISDDNYADNADLWALGLSTTHIEQLIAKIDFVRNVAAAQPGMASMRFWDASPYLYLDNEDYLNKYANEDWDDFEDLCDAWYEGWHTPHTPIPSPVLKLAEFTPVRTDTDSLVVRSDSVRWEGYFKHSSVLVVSATLYLTDLYSFMGNR